MCSGEGRAERAGDTDVNGICGGIGGDVMAVVREGAGVALGCSARLGAGNELNLMFLTCELKNVNGVKRALRK